MFCHVTYSNPSGVRIQLTENGINLHHGLKWTGPLPNGDGTLQMRLQADITVDNKNEYKWVVNSDTNTVYALLGKATTLVLESGPCYSALNLTPHTIVVN